MDANSQVATSAWSGLPFVWLSDLALWNLMRYIASHGKGVRYDYSFSANGFEVTFYHMDETAVERLMDEWSRSRASNSPGVRLNKMAKGRRVAAGDRLAGTAYHQRGAEKRG